MKISKNAGSLLKPHVSLLVVPLLESITTLEPQVVNYYSLHAASNQAAQDKVRRQKKMTDSKEFISLITD
jgi:proteasome component ECM29